MNAHTFHFLPVLRAVVIAAAWQSACVVAQDVAPSAKELAARLGDRVADGSSFVRLKMEVRAGSGGASTVLQLQVKARRTSGASDILYQVLFPKERKGEAVLLRKSGSTLSGKVFVPPAAQQAISAAQMKDALLGSDLAYEDIIENFFTWDQQAIVGAEVVDRVSCQILESKPGKGERSSYARVRSWIDVKRLVPLRIEKYSASGQLLRSIKTTRVAEDDQNRPIPASLTVQRAGKDSVSELDGSSSRHDVVYTDADFTVEGMQLLAPPRSAR